jgi:dTDP-4-amino-4,6-dideoxygalactose transaminase
MTDKLAINGGKPAISANFERYTWVDKGVLPRIEELILSNSFSGFIAQPVAEHLGGPAVRKLETNWSELFNTKYAVTFNSWTSGLVAAIASLGLKKGSEVIVTPWTMSASVACLVANGLVPVFADIEIDSFNIDPSEVSRKITRNTSAILAVDIFGKPCNAPTLNKISEDNGLKIVIDAAQTPRAEIQGKRSAAFADIAGYSLNRHKHLQVGEGGVAVTNSELYLERMRLMRNHSEVTSGTVLNEVVPIGHNWRMGEIEAELASYQLERFNSHIDHRVDSARNLINLLRDIPEIQLPEVANRNSHDFYILGIRINETLVGQRATIANALKAEGITNLIVGYQALHLLPSFRSYRQENLLNTNKLHDETFLGLYMCGYNFSAENISEISQAFHKVFSRFSEI